MSDSSQALALKRHSAAHLLAAAVQELKPGTRFGVGPAIDTGFFYDMEVPGGLTMEDLPKIEKRMRRIQKRKVKFERRDISIGEAIAEMAENGQDYKVELLNALREKGTTAIAKELDDDNLVSGGLDTVSFYELGTFTDLCTGPHVEHAGQIAPFKLHTIAGAYWRGNENNPQLQRVYGLCFDTPEEIDRHLWMLEEQKRRDHRTLGRQLGIYTISRDVGSGLPLWLPNGVNLRMELERLAEEAERRHGFERVVTPSLAKEDLFYRSGHLPYYKEDMYAPVEIDKAIYYLKPMNCPFHHEIFRANKHSYRDMPQRYAEYGTVYRYEASGALSGLMRTRGFTQNDAHIYCRFDQAKEEFLQVMRMHAEFYDTIGIEDYYMLLAKPDMAKLDKYVNKPDEWTESLRVIEDAMRESGYPYREAEGEAAFYGPKIDFMIRSVIGTEYAISTNQLDFLATERFALSYTGADGAQHPVYVIHRAPLGSHERFVAFLIEHFAGAFPTWLAPVQAVVVPITDRHIDYAGQVAEKLKFADVVTGTGGLRIEVDRAGERMQKKIRTAQNRKIPYMLVVGDQEAETGTVAVRLRSGADLGAMSLDTLIARLRTEIAARRDIPERTG